MTSKLTLYTVSTRHCAEREEEHADAPVKADIVNSSGFLARDYLPLPRLTATLRCLGSSLDWLGQQSTLLST